MKKVELLDGDDFQEKMVRTYDAYMHSCDCIDSLAM